MQNVIRSKQSLSDEELAKLKEFDWESYYRESASAEVRGMSNCPDCNAILVAPDDQQEFTCYNCGRKITP